MIPLEQNYRSTNAILDAANAVIAHNRERKEKNLWSELGEGEPVHVVETEDEHAEARFVAAEIAALIEAGYSAAEIAVVYRTNAQSRVLEDVLVRQGIAYQVIGGPKFYERAEVKDPIAYLQVLDNPYDAVSLLRIANRPRRGIGDTSLARLVGYAAGLGMSLWEATAQPEEAGLAPPRRGRSRLPERDGVAAGDRDRLDRRRASSRRCSTAAAISTALEAERTIEARGRIENLEELVGVAREYDASAQEPSLSGLPPGDLALLRPGRDPRRGRRAGRAGHADDAAQREGARVPRRVHARDGGGDLPALALDRGELARGGAAAVLRRHDAGEGAADAHPRDAPQPVRAERGEPAVALPRRAAGARRRARAAAAGVLVGLRAIAAQREFAPREDVPDLSTGDTVRHASLGTGIVTRIESGGVVTVRFEDGSERRLMLEYAPLETIG